MRAIGTLADQRKAAVDAGIELGAACLALGAYRARIVPRVRRELHGWEERSESIQDPAVRYLARRALREKRSNPEATAVFALFAPRRQRAAALRAGVALQVAVDYLDLLTEQPERGLAESLRLHQALVSAVSPRQAGPPGAAPQDWSSAFDDGGYLASLVDACRHALEELPAYPAVEERLRIAARRCGEGQSHTHAGGESLRRWADGQPAPPGYSWWEVAAGGSSSVAAHALLCAAADPGTTAADAALLDAAYHPPIGALTVLLDDLVDRDRDRAEGQHNYTDYCGSGEEAADRLGLLAGRALGAAAGLRRPHLHRAILAGVAAFYLAQPAAGSQFAQPVRIRLLEVLGLPARLLLAAVRLLATGA